MFQVASPHPQHPGHQQHSSVSLPTTTIQLPRTLSRPKFTDISRDALAAVSPDLADVPSEYIRRGLCQNPGPLLRGISAFALPPTLPRSQIPSVLEVSLSIPSDEVQYPSHILAISSAKSSRSDPDYVYVFAVHALVLTANCARLPALPPSNPSPSESGHLTLPILPVTLPSPAAFHVILRYLYTHRFDGVMTALGFPASSFQPNLTHQHVLATLQSRDTVHSLAVLLCRHTSGNLVKLTALTAHVRDLWQDMVSLGIFDNELWDTLDLAWEVLLGALNLAVLNQH